MYVHIYATYEVTGTNHSTRGTVWLPHSEYNLLGQHAKLAYRPNSFVYVTQSTTHYHIYFPWYCQISARYKFDPQICHIWQILDVHIWGMYVHIHATLKNSVRYKVVYTQTTDVDCYWLNMASQISQKLNMEFFIGKTLIRRKTGKWIRIKPVIVLVTLTRNWTAIQHTTRTRHIIRKCTLRTSWRSAEDKIDVTHISFILH